MTNQGRTRGRERARLFELASSTWNKLPINNFWTHAHRNYGHTNKIACVSSPLRVSMRPRMNGDRQVSSVKYEGKSGPGTGVENTEFFKEGSPVEFSYPYDALWNSTYSWGEYPAPFFATVCIPEVMAMCMRGLIGFGSTVRALIPTHRKRTDHTRSIRCRKRK